MKNPVSKSEAKTFAPWRIQCDPHPQNCIVGDGSCEVMHTGEARPEKMWMEVCGDCPPNSYPWIFNPLGEKMP